MLRVALGGRGCSIPVGIGSDARNGLCFGGCSELHSEVSVGSIPVGIGSGGLENMGRFAGFDKPGGLEWV